MSHQRQHSQLSWGAYDASPTSGAVGTTSSAGLALMVLPQLNRYQISWRSIIFPYHACTGTEPWGAAEAMSCGHWGGLRGNKKGKQRNAVFSSAVWLFWNQTWEGLIKEAITSSGPSLLATFRWWAAPGPICFFQTCASWQFSLWPPAT